MKDQDGGFETAKANIPAPNDHERLRHRHEENPQGQEISPSRVSDRPHSLTVVLSLTALFLSCLSLYESHRSRKLSELTGRAVVQVVDLKLASDWDWNPKRQQAPDNISVEIGLYNSGKTMAKNIGFRIDLWVLFKSEAAEQAPFALLIEPKKSGGQSLEIGPGVAKTYRVAVSLAASRDLVWQNFVHRREDINRVLLAPSLEYYDEATQAHYKEDSCFELTMSNGSLFKAGPLPRCQSVPPQHFGFRQQ